MTNYLSGNSYESTRGEFDDKGFAHVWRWTRVDNGVATERVVTFKEIDLTPSFSDESVFAPAFPTNYFVSDMTLPGTAVLLQNPSPDLDNCGDH
jgi:DNA-binding transcriptional regulator of glucitol operon